MSLIALPCGCTWDPERSAGMSTVCDEARRLQALPGMDGMREYARHFEAQGWKSERDDSAEERLRRDCRQGRIFIALLLGRLGDRAEFSAAELVAAEEAALVTRERPETGGMVLYVLRDPASEAPEQ